MTVTMADPDLFDLLFQIQRRTAIDYREVEQEVFPLSLLMPTEELAALDGNVHAERVEPTLLLNVRPEGRGLPHVYCKAKFLDGPGYCDVEHLIVSQPPLARLRERERIQQGYLLAAARRVARPHHPKGTR